MVITNSNVIHVSISSDMVEAIRLIAKINFYDIQCIPGHQARALSRKLLNFIKVRSTDDYIRFMKYYGLESLSRISIFNADSIFNNEMLSFAETLADAETKDCGVVVSVHA